MFRIFQSINIYIPGSWCKLGKKKCRGGGQQWVKPFRCLEGPFQSDALLVPEHCLFDHIHNQTRCWDFDMWNTTASNACKGRGMKVKSFAMLLPCGIDVFSGVEFVCCPAKKTRKVITKEEKTLADAWPEELKLKKLDEDLLADEDDYDDEDYYDEDYDEDEDDLYDDEEYYEDDYKDDDKDALGDIQVAIHFPQDESSSSSSSPTTSTTTTTTSSTTTTTTTTTT